MPSAGRAWLGGGGGGAARGGWGEGHGPAPGGGGLGGGGDSAAVGLKRLATLMGGGPNKREPARVVFFYRGIGPSFKNPVALSIYLSKKRAPCLSAYLSISPKNGRLTFFAPPPHAFVGFLKDEKWHVGPGFTPVSGKSSRENGPQMASSGIFLAFDGPLA